MNAPTKELLFVYNADGDVFSQVTDFAHKIFSPQTYQCPLCTLTYGNFAMKTKWRDVLKTISFPKTFLHRDDFLRRFPRENEAPLPAIYIFIENQLRMLISADELKTFSSLDDLIALFQKKIAAI
jgi:hypothetical protein